MSEVKEYKLSTIKDIFDKVPADRIDDCMREITAIINKSKKIQKATAKIGNTMNTVGDLYGIEKLMEMRTIFPETITWIDDHKGEINITVQVETEKKE